MKKTSLFSAEFLAADLRVGKPRNFDRKFRTADKKAAHFAAYRYLIEYVLIDDLMPQEHLLRKIDKYIDFSFINEICRPYYCKDNG